VKRAAVLGAVVALGGAALLATHPLRAAPDGATVFARCAACHTRTGAGVPGAYPPLGADFRALAAKDAGRRYIVLAVTRGLMGPITVEGRPYAGVMPAQGGLDDGAVAAVLNHVGTKIAKTGPAFRPFDSGEVARLRQSGASLGPADVARLHAGAGGK
jgi:mono/diheme cytochrome c family protein